MSPKLWATWSPTQISPSGRTMPAPDPGSDEQTRTFWPGLELHVRRGRGDELAQGDPVGLAGETLERARDERHTFFDGLVLVRATSCP